MLEHGSALYRDAVQLRIRLLRAPLGRTLSEAELAGEASDLHFGLVSEGVVTATAVATFTGEAAVRIRQMAVAPEQQRRGLGRELLHGVEQALRQRGVHDVFLHARESATGFYQRCGYRPAGRPFVALEIPHQRMEKRL